MLRSIAFDGRCFDQLAGFIDGARRWVLMTTFEFAPDAGPQIVDALNQAAVRGCQTRLVVNNWRASRNANRCSKALREALVPQVELRLWRHSLMNNTHGKFAVRDDGQFLVLTSNVTHQFLLCRWRGVGMVFDEPRGAARMLDAFRYLWRQAKPQRCTGHLLGGRTVTVPSLRVPLSHVHVVWQTECWSCVNDRADAEPVQAVWRMIDLAECTIDIVTPNLSSRSILQRLVAAHDRGVRVRCVLSRSLNTFYKYVGHLTNEQVARRYPFEIRWANESKPKCRVRASCHRSSQPYDVNHTKLMVTDETHVLFGSTNLDFFSLKHAAELNVVFEDPTRYVHGHVFQRFWSHSLQ
jgi:phosphatidylserine/phosphatidylglycerophosphate/cardiolipin synthase-like enzyme